MYDAILRCCTVVSEIWILNKSVFTMPFFCFFQYQCGSVFNIVIITHTCILPFILRKMSPSTLFPHPRNEEESLFTPPPTSQSIWAYAWLLPDNHLTQPCSLLPGSRKKPFLSARKETVRKVSFRVFNGPTLPLPQSRPPHLFSLLWVQSLGLRPKASAQPCSPRTQPHPHDFVQTPFPLKHWKGTVWFIWLYLSPVTH